MFYECYLKNLDEFFPNWDSSFTLLPVLGLFCPLVKGKKAVFRKVCIRGKKKEKKGRRNLVILPHVPALTHASSNFGGKISYMTF